VKELPAGLITLITTAPRFLFQADCNIINPFKYKWCLFFKFPHRKVGHSQSHLTTDGQSASLSWCQGTIRDSDRFFFLLEIFFRQLRVCYFVAPSLTRGRVCKLLLLLVLASAVPRDSRSYFIVAILETPPTWRARSPYLYPPGTGYPSYTPGHWVPFMSPLTARRDCGGGILTRLHTGKSEIFLLCHI
jgi:hypothetical protein